MNNSSPVDINDFKDILGFIPPVASDTEKFDDMFWIVRPVFCYECYFRRSVLRHFVSIHKRDKREEAKKNWRAFWYKGYFCSEHQGAQESDFCPRENFENFEKFWNEYTNPANPFINLNIFICLT
jgi:hypothetical protein